MFVQEEIPAFAGMTLLYQISIFVPATDDQTFRILHLLVLNTFIFLG